MKKIPMRMCVVTHEKYPKKDLIRVVSFEGNISVDITGKQNGKGAYLKKELSVIEKAQKSGLLERVLEVKIPDEIYDFLKKEV